MVATPGINQTDIETLVRYYQTRPIEFCKDIIHFHPTEQQLQIIEAINHPGAWVSVKSGHGVGKTSTLACLALWFISVFTESRVPITHPAKEQLKATLWPEIHKWHSQMEDPFGPAIDITAEKVSIIGREDTFAQARTCKQGSSDALQGFHAPHLLFFSR